MGDDLSNNFVTVAADGTISFSFTGVIHAQGVTLDFARSGESASPGANRIQWLDVVDLSQAVQLLASDQGVGAPRVQLDLQASSIAGGGDVAQARLSLQVDDASGANAAIKAFVIDAGGVQTLRNVIDTLGRSDYLQLSSLQTDVAGRALVLGQVRVVHLLNGTVTYTPTTGLKALYVECMGAGGGGGGCLTAITNAAAAGGGGGGGYSAVFTTTLKSSYTVAIGGGGAGGAAGANPGAAGGNTSFDTGPSICTALGGGGGGASTVTTPGPLIGGAAGGITIGTPLGDARLPGTIGDTGLILAAAVALSGKGGVGAGLAGGGAAGRSTQGAGTAAISPGGGGGSGGCILSGGASVAGGNGANGLLRVWEIVALT